MTEIRYKENIIPVEAGKTVTLSTNDKKLTDDIVITADIVESIEEWDGSYTVRGGIISFTIADISYQAENGMTWGQWAESEYSPSITVESTRLLLDGSSIQYNSKEVLPDETIISDTAYTLYQHTSG